MSAKPTSPLPPTSPPNTPGFQAGSRPLSGMAMLAIGHIVFSTQDVLVKLISHAYPVHEIVLIRSLIAVWPMILLSWILDKGQGMQLSRPGWQTLRAFLLSMAFTTYYLAFGALSLAQATALFFTAPLFITLIAWATGQGHVGWRRLAGVGLGFVGVLIMIRPEADIPLVPALFAVSAALFYAISMVMTSWLGKTESAASMSLVFMFMNLIVGLLMFVSFGSGWALPHVPESLAFLVRAWSWPAPEHMAFLLAIGLMSVAGFMLLMQAYRLAPSHMAAPMEYALLIYNMLWSVFYFGEQLDRWTLVGTALIVGSGFFVLYREGERRDSIVKRLFRPRRVR